MRNYYATILHVILIVFVLFSCKKKELDPVPLDTEPVNIEDVSFPISFDFETSEKVEIDFTASADTAVFVIYAVFTDKEEELLSKGACTNGRYEKTLTIPADCEQIKVLEVIGLSTSSTFIPLGSNNIAQTFKYNLRKDKADCSELLYAVNGDGGFYTIDNEGGDYTETVLPNLTGGGSIACAVDKSNRIVYYNTNTTLRYYDIDAGTFHVAQSGNPFNGNYPRMEYNNTNGQMYIAKDEKMYIIDPITNSLISTFDIVGLESPVGGGDVAISLDGTIYMCCFSGLYRIEIDGNTANATRISAENLPFQPTSMAIDRNDRLYLATNDANSHLIEMDKFDGAWSIVKTYSHKINDLGSLPCSIDELPDVDTDGDGIIDALDDHPNDSTKAFDTYTPSEFGYGSLSFEDQWPAKGDFDLNDMVVDYNFIAVANKNNEVVELRAKFVLRAIGASFHNGFGFEMPFDPSLISSVTGYELEEGIVTLDANGTEAGQTNAVVVVFDDTYNHMTPSGGSFVNTETEHAFVTPDTFNISIAFVNPIPDEDIGEAPFNPFVIVDRDRGRELHLPNRAPTDLMNSSYFGTIDDESDPGAGIYYKTANGAPFAINNIHKFRYPKEKQPINSAYNYFISWSISLGASYKDWYKDNSGYRNTSKIYFE